MTSKWSYWCKIKKKMVPGFPPPCYDRYGDAPIVIFDSMPETYHEAAKMKIDSRAAWREADKACGTMTVGSVSELDNVPPSDNIEARRYDIMQARKRAVAAVKNGTSPFTDDQKQLFKNQDQIISSQLGYNVEEIWKPKKKSKLRKMANQKDKQPKKAA